MAHTTKARIMIKEIEITSIVLDRSQAQAGKITKEKKKTSSAIAMTDQPNIEDEEWYKATYTISLSGCGNGSINRITVNLDKDIRQSDSPAISMME